MPAAPGEKALAGELMVALTTSFIVHIYQNQALPKPTQILGIVFAYAGLSLVALAGPGPARVAGGIGALVLLTIVVQHGAALFSATNLEGGTTPLPPGVQGPVRSATPVA